MRGSRTLGTVAGFIDPRWLMVPGFIADRWQVKKYSDGNTAEAGVAQLCDALARGASLANVGKRLQETPKQKYIWTCIMMLVSGVNIR